MSKNKKQKANTKNNQSFSEVTGLSAFIHNEKANFTVGFVLMAISVVVFIAFASYINTGALDQSLMMHPQDGDIDNTKQSFQNVCGSLGAYVSYFFVKCCFGFPAFVIPAFFFVASLKLIGINKKINLWQWFLCMAFVMEWCCITCAKFLSPILDELVFNPGGDHGAFICFKLESWIGTPGLTAVIIATAVAFLTILSSKTIDIIRKMLNPSEYISRKVTFKVAKRNMVEEAEGDTVETPMSPVAPVYDEPTEETDIPQEETSDGTDASSQEEDEESNEQEQQETNDEPGFTVNQGVEEEAASGNTLNNVDLNTPINPKEPFINYRYPSLDLLKKYNDTGDYTTTEELLANKKRIIEVLNSFGVQIKEITATVGPTITLYEITPAEGVRISKIRNLEDDIALSLSALGIRIIAPIPGKGTIGIEVPNAKACIVSMESILNSRKFQETHMELPLALGKTITNEVFMVDLAKIPHLLVAGATGQGKSVGLNAMIGSLLYKKHPNELKIVLVDPKKVEFSIYNPIANAFMAQVPDVDEDPIITDVNKVVRTLKGLCTLMDHRYDLLKLAGVRNIKEYNTKFINHQLRMTDEDGNPLHEYMPYIVVIIDEFGDLIMTAGKEVELPIARIAQLARAVGIHMIIATQRPTTNIITGTIKANFPGRVAFRVGAMIDSRTILDRPGANQLIGKGDMLYLNGNEPVRVQCAFLDTPEVERISQHIHEQELAGLTPQYPMELPEPVDDSGDAMGGGGALDTSNWDPLFEQSAHAVVSTQQGSTSMIQRQFSIGYNRAGRIMDQLEKAGIVGAAHGSKPREVLYADEVALDNHIASLRGK